jgi:hypothetical protein
MPLEEKRQVLIDVLDKIKDKHKSLWEIYVLIKSDWIISDKKLQDLFFLILSVVEAYEKWQLAKWVEKLSKIQSSTLDDIRKREASEEDGFDLGSELANA